MQAKNVFLPRETHQESPEVHIAGSCFKEQNGRFEILFARRSPHRQLFAGKLEGCGGQLRQGESFTEGVQRHFLQELNLSVQPLKNIFTTYDIPLKQGVIPGIRYLCKYAGGQPTLINHTDLIWLSEQEFLNADSTDFVGGLKNELLELLDLYRIIRVLEEINRK